MHCTRKRPDAYFIEKASQFYEEKRRAYGETGIPRRPARSIVRCTSPEGSRWRTLRLRPGCVRHDSDLARLAVLPGTVLGRHHAMAVGKFSLGAGEERQPVQE